VTLTIYQLQGEGTTPAADGSTDVTPANIGVNRITSGTDATQVNKGTGSQKLAVATPPPGVVYYVEYAGTNTVNIDRFRADTPSKTMSTDLVFRTPDVTPPNISNPTTMATVRWWNVTAGTFGIAMRVMYDYQSRILLRDFSNTNTNDIVALTSVPLNTWYRMDLDLIVGSATTAPFDGHLALDFYTPPNSSTPANVSPVTSSTWNLGTQPIYAVDPGMIAAVSQTQKFGLAQIKLENDRGSHIGQLLANTAAGGTSGTQITSAAQTGGKSGAYLSLADLSGATVWFDSAHARTSGGMGYRVDVPANAAGYLTVPLGVRNTGVTACRLRMTKYIDALPSTSERIFDIRATNGGRICQAYITSTGKLRFDDSSANSTTSGQAVLVGQQITFEVYFTIGGSLGMRAYKNNDPAGGTLFERTTDSPGTINADSLRLGRGVAIATAGSHYWSEIYYEPYVGGSYLGPYAGGINTNAANFTAPPTNVQVAAGTGSFGSGTVSGAGQAIDVAFAVTTGGTFTARQKTNQNATAQVTATGAAGVAQAKLATAQGAVTATGTLTGTTQRSLIAGGAVTSTGVVGSTSVTTASVQPAVVTSTGTAAAQVVGTSGVLGTVAAIGTAAATSVASLASQSAVTALGQVAATVTRPGSASGQVTATGSASSTQTAPVVAQGIVTSTMDGDATVGYPIAAALGIVTDTGTVSGATVTYPTLSAVVTATAEADVLQRIGNNGASAQVTATGFVIFSVPGGEIPTGPGSGARWRAWVDPVNAELEQGSTEYVEVHVAWPPYEGIVVDFCLSQERHEPANPQWHGASITTGLVYCEVGPGSPVGMLPSGTVWIFLRVSNADQESPIIRAGHLRVNRLETF
jgi:hypothetical protein